MHTCLMPRNRIPLDETVIYNLALYGCSRSQIAAICGVHMDTIRDNYESVVREGHRACSGTLLSKAMKMAFNEPASKKAKKPYGEKVQATMLMFLLTKIANISPDVGKTLMAGAAQDDDAADPEAMDDDALDKRISYIMDEVRRSGAPLQLPAGVAVIDARTVADLPTRKVSKPYGGSKPGPRKTSYPEGRKRPRGHGTRTNVDNIESKTVHVDDFVHDSVHATEIEGQE